MWLYKLLIVLVNINVYVEYNILFVVGKCLSYYIKRILIVIVIMLKN